MVVGRNMERSNNANLLWDGPGARQYLRVDTFARPNSVSIDLSIKMCSLSTVTGRQVMHGTCTQTSSTRRCNHKVYRIKKETGERGVIIEAKVYYRVCFTYPHLYRVSSSLARPRSGARETRDRLRLEADHTAALHLPASEHFPQPRVLERLDPSRRLGEVEFRQDRVLEGAHDRVEWLGVGVEWYVNRLGLLVLSLRLRPLGRGHVWRVSAPLAMGGKECSGTYQSG